MSESIKFGPEWLRNSLSTSPPKQEEIICRPIMSENRYSREEMLGLLDERNSRKLPEFIVNGSRRLHTNHYSSPMVLTSSDDEKPVSSGHSRTFLNSNIKHGSSNNNSSNWRKGAKEPEQENWRNQDHKKEAHYNPTSSRNGERSKPNWRDKGHNDEQASHYPYSPAKDYEFKPQEKDEISPTKTIPNKPQITPKRAETVEEKQNQYVLNIVSDTTTKNLFENSMKSNEIKKIEKPNIQSSSSSTNPCELNFKKLENDILMGLQELTVDDEEIIEKSNDNNKQQNNNLISWFYVDPIGKIQGPFNADEMSLWYNHGFFYDTLMLRRSIDNNFISLHHLIQAFGSAQPFVIASTGFPIPKVDHVDNLPYKQPQKMPQIMNSQNQFDAAMFRGQNLMQQFQDQGQYQNNIQQFQQNIPPNFQYLQNRPPQPNIPQVDPRLMTMNNGNPYIQAAAFNALNNNPNRIPQQIPPQMMNQIQHQMKTPYQGPIANQYSQSMIHQMPSILPTNPIQKLLFELQKQKEMEQQRAIFMQHSQNVAVQSMNEQIMQQQQNKIENSRQNKIQQAYYNNMQNKYEQNGANTSLNGTNAAVNSNNQAVQQNNIQHINNNVQHNNNNNFQHNQVIEPTQEPKSYDIGDEGEFRVVGSLRRKKFQKEKCDKAKENGPQSSRSATRLPEGKITVIKNDLRVLNTDVKEVKSNNDISQIIINQLNKVEEKSKLPTMPAPWIDKVLVNKKESENLKRIQIEEEEIRQIEMQIKREKELEKAKKEQELKQRVAQLSWNIVVTEKPEENTKDAPSTSSINNTRQSLTAEVKPKPLESSSSSTQQDVEHEFKNWCLDMLSKMVTSIDIPVFVSFLIDLESPFEIEDYVKMYLGDTIECHLFTRKFLERRSLYRKATKKVEVDDDLCAPPKAINPGTHNEEPFRTQYKKKLDKKTRKGMKVADANILGFKTTAASNRIVGELHEDEY
ncbi:hypothetical protein ACKWTF_013159 [Chironomus riparius]